ncbi:hypothetical protein [Moritella viscosa]|uniref:Uncharacterized protein n=1 Tax=Moritella viscosa TaxID=80854 RepID=A0A1L0BK97_9GAMM|nr:hypothetical protein [Moritella viscosa]SGZ04004.1 Putative uncharacterized protein vep56-Putative uncharacterized protein vpa04-Putative uncharacterized protein vpb04 [Moritella viscosa]
MFELFDWKMKLGAVFTIALLVASIISFVIAWHSPVPTDAMSAVTKYLNYRWFAAFTFGVFSIGSATVRYYHKRVNQFY